MLKSLHIENIAVIEQAAVDFSDGLGVLTGETGAGKSVMIDAINAALGSRTSRELVRSGAEKATVTAGFESERAARWLRKTRSTPTAA
ncbi:MAG: AAA family ATPase, partial [Oscillospiraceae bacterium]|nr:AAA family ATPase [Oscillospiraceae bacterium]